MGTRIRNNPDHVYEVFCEIGIPIASNESAWITWKYPYSFKAEETLKSLPEFAYPVEFDENAVYHFSFVLTNLDSKWTFGFCRHTPDSSTCLVILSYLPWHEVFYRILNQIAELSNNDKCDNSDVQLYLEALYKTKVPDPGLELCVTYGEKVFTATAPDCNKLPSIPENRNITEYFNAINSTNMITIFASMLHERRILIVSKKLSRLSACVQAANSLIYPMHWQHIFIPVLPKLLLDYLCAPMPFLIGVPTATFSHMKQADMGDVVILQADENVVITPFADTDALPSEVLQSLRHDLKNPIQLIGDSVARAFLRASVKLIGGYWNALKLKPGEKISFCPEAFVQTRPLPMQPFLEKMLELQIFQQFIECRLKMLNSGQGVSDVFEFELTAHEDKASTRLRNQYRDWVSNMKKEGGAFFKSVRTKVKDTSKKAYKDLRSKVHEMRHDNAKIMDDMKSGFRKRGNSAPILFPNGLEVPSELSNGSHTLGTDRGGNADKSTTDKNNLTLPLSNAQKSNSDLESPILTFEHINMDLIDDDLQKYFVSNCSLLTDVSSSRVKSTSISDPDISSRVDDFSYNPFKSKDLTNEDTPPPLLPRPPSSSKSTSKQLHSPLSPSYSKELLDEPLIELHDGGNVSDFLTNCDNVFPLNEKNGNVTRSDEQKITEFNPFKDSFTDSTFNSNLSFVPVITSTNPFYPQVENSSQLRTNLELSSGPNVKNMVNMWQSSNAVPFNVHIAKTNTTLPISNITPYRSRPILRTSAPVPPTLGTTNALYLPNDTLKSKNPFNTTQVNINKNELLNTKSKCENLTWENFQ